MRAFEYIAVDSSGRERKASSRGTRHGRCGSCCATRACFRSPSARSRTDKPPTPEAAPIRPETREFRDGSRASDPSARDAGERGAAARRVPAGGLPAIREAARQQYRARRTFAGNGRPCARGRPARVSRVFPEMYRATSPPASSPESWTPCWNGSPITRKTVSRFAQHGDGADLSDAPDRRMLHDRLLPPGFGRSQRWSRSSETATPSCLFSPRC